MKKGVSIFFRVGKQKSILSDKVIGNSVMIADTHFQKRLSQCGILLAVAMLLMVGKVHACSKYYPDVAQSVDFGTITVPDTLPVGSVIKTVKTAPKPGPSPTSCAGTMVTVPYGGPVIRENNFPMPNVYATVIPGIGMGITANNVDGKDINMNSNESAPRVDSAQTYYTVTLYKTGTVSAGTFPALGTIGWVQIQFTQAVYGSWLRTGSVTTVVPVTPTCNLSTTDVNRTVTLDTFQLKNIPTGNGKFGLKYFTITAQCTGATTASFQFSGTPSSLDGSLFASTGTAKGLGMHLASAYGDIPANGSAAQRTVSIGVSGGTAKLDMEAGYSRKSAVAVTAGTFASKATVTLSYH